jgi:hypothetical protein
MNRGIMTKQILVRLISEMLREKFPTKTIKSIENLLNQGHFMTVFAEAVDKALLDSIAEDWQKEQDAKRVSA